MIWRGPSGLQTVYIVTYHSLHTTSFKHIAYQIQWHLRAHSKKKKSKWCNRIALLSTVRLDSLHLFLQIGQFYSICVCNAAYTHKLSHCSAQPNINNEKQKKIIDTNIKKPTRRYIVQLMEMKNKGHFSIKRKIYN